MENDVKSMPTWFWYVAAIVAAYGIYAYLKAKSSVSSSVASEIAGVTASTGAAPASSGSSSVDLTGVNSSLSTITASLNNIPSLMTADFSQAIAGLGAGMTQMESDIKGYLAQQTASINSGMGAMANQIDTGFAAQQKSFGGLTTLINTENASISSLSTSVGQVTANEAQIAGMSAFSVIKDILGGLNTANNAIAKSLPSCVSGSGNNAAIDYNCLGSAILSGKTSVATITGGK